MSNIQEQAAELQQIINSADANELRGMLKKVSELYDKQCNTINNLRDSMTQAVACLEEGFPGAATSTLKSALKDSQP